MTGVGKTDNLLQQLQKIANHCNQGSIETRHRNLDGMVRFVDHVAQRFNMQNIKNIQDKHLESMRKT